MKPGYKTTEFYVTLTAWLASIVAGAAHWLPPTAAVAIGAASGALYAISRGLAKLNAAGLTSLDPKAIIAEVEALIGALPPVPPKV
jgi:hypothetical protein